MAYLKYCIITVLTAVIVYYDLIPITVTLRNRVTPEFGGIVDLDFELVKQTFEKNFQSNWELEGAAFAVCHKGKMVVDIWGGFADSSALRKWHEDTMTVAFSSTKSICALSLAMLVDRGFLKYDDLVVKYWPEFGKNEKQNITVKMLASHEAGLASLNEEITFDLVKDWRKMSKAFEEQSPNWKLGTGAGYHVYTYGWLIDQLFRRVDPKQRSIGKFFHEEIAVPHNIDFYIGLPLEYHHRVARLTMPRLIDYALRMSDVRFLKVIIGYFTQSSDSIFQRIMKNPKWVQTSTGVNVFNNPELHQLEIGSANGIGTARALAQLFCLLNSETLLSKATFNEILQPVWLNEQDHVMKLNMTWGYGFWHTKNPDGGYQIGHPGYGGQNVKYDPQYELSFAYLRNGLGPDFGDMTWSFKALQKSVYDSLKLQEARNVVQK